MSYTFRIQPVPKLEDLIRFCFEHGGTLRNHKEFIELCNEARREQIELRNAVKAERETCARIAESQTAANTKQYLSYRGPADTSPFKVFSQACEQIATAIRSRQ